MVSDQLGMGHEPQVGQCQIGHGAGTTYSRHDEGWCNARSMSRPQAADASRHHFSTVKCKGKEVELLSFTIALQFLFVLADNSMIR